MITAREYEQATCRCGAKYWTWLVWEVTEDGNRGQCVKTESENCGVLCETSMAKALEMHNTRSRQAHEALITGNLREAVHCLASAGEWLGELRATWGPGGRYELDCLLSSYRALVNAVAREVPR